MSKGIQEHLDNMNNKTASFAAFPEENQSIAEGLLLPADFVFLKCVLISSTSEIYKCY